MVPASTASRAVEPLSMRPHPPCKVSSRGNSTDDTEMINRWANTGWALQEIQGARKIGNGSMERMYKYPSGTHHLLKATVPDLMESKVGSGQIQIAKLT